MSHHLETATDLAPKLRSGEVASEDVVRDCFAQIEATDSAIQAWTYLDEDHALAQARVHH